MGIFGKKTGTQRSSPMLNACQCSPKIAYGPESFPYKDFPPPKPPNGQDDLWELQFCRWWGWNWVRKKEIEGMTNPNQTTIMYGNKVDDSPPKRKQGGCLQSSCFQKKGNPEGERVRPKSNRPPPSPRSPRTQRRTCQCYQTRTYGGYPNSPLPTKRELKDLCKCIVFQKPSRELPPPELQNLYNTPSHSVVMERERYSFNRFNREPRYVPCESMVGGHHTSPRREKQRKKKSCATSWCGKPKHTSSSEEVICTQQFSQPYQNISTQCRPSSSTEESIEYLTVRMQHVKSDTRCPCQSHMPSKKQSVQTIPVAPPMEDIACQCTVPSVRPSRPCMCPPNDEKVIKYKGKKKKTLCICVCCCNCCKKDGNDEKNSEHGDNPPKKESKIKNEPKSSTHIVTKENEDNPEENAADPGDGIQIKQEYNPSNQKTYVSHFSMPLSYRVKNLRPSSSKEFSKFGNPSRNYPWLNTSFSNDTTMSILSDDTFTSPISGKTYNFAALQFHTNEKTKLPDLLDASEDLQYLKNIQSSIKNESEQKILFDAVCDALLAEPNNFDEQSSNLLNEVSFNNGIKNSFNFKYTSEFPDFQWPLLNEPSQNNVRLPKLDKDNNLDYDEDVMTKASNIFKFDHVSKFNEPFGRPLSNIPSEQENAVKILEKHSTGSKINVNNESTLARSTLREPVNSFVKYDQKERFTSQEINAFIDRVLKVDTGVHSKFSEPQVARVIQEHTLDSLENTKKEGVTNKTLENKQKTATDVSGHEKRTFKFEPVSVNEKPDFSKTGLLSAKGVKTIPKKSKRSAIFSPRENIGSKRYKADKKLSFNEENIGNKKFFKSNLIGKIDSVGSDKGNPFLEPETTKNADLTQDIERESSLEKVKGSLDDIFAKIDKIMTNSNSNKNEKLSYNLPCLSEKSEPDETIYTNSKKIVPDNVPPLKLNTVVDTKMKSYDAFSFGSSSNRSEISKGEILNENLSEHDALDITESKFESDDDKSCSAISKTSTVNSARFESTSSVILGLKSSKRKRYLAKKSMIPVRKKQK